MGTQKNYVPLLYVYIKPYGERRSELLGMFTGHMIPKSVVCTIKLTNLFTALSHIIVIVMLFIESVHPLLLLQEEPDGVMVDYIIPPHHHHHQQHHQHQQLLLEPGSSMSIGASVDRGLSFADVMQFADFGPKLVLHHPHDHHQQQGQDASIENFNRDGDPNNAIDAVNFLKFPVLNNQLIMSGGPGNGSHSNSEGVAQFIYDQQENRNANIYNNPVQLEFMSNAAGNSTDENIVETTGEKIGHGNLEGAAAGKNTGTTKRKRPRTIKTTEEVESQRMTHIAVERNRRKQMNEHLRVLRSLMPSSYVQRVSTYILSKSSY